jgi:GNS1/SUR4 family.
MNFLSTMDTLYTTKLTLPSFSWPLGGVICYLVIIFGLQEIMKKYEPFKFKWLLFVHNMALMYFSLGLVIGISHSLISLLRSGYSMYDLYCGGDTLLNNPHAIALYNWCYLFYASKYYEFFDTLFLVLKKKPLSFLHVYHHASVVLICWLALHDEITMVNYFSFFFYILFLKNLSLIHILLNRDGSLVIITHWFTL